MKPSILLLAALIGLSQIAATANAQQPKKVHHTHHLRNAGPAHPKNEFSKLRRERRTNHTVRQMTVDPKVSPGKHASHLGRNVNNEVNRESKGFNHGVNNMSKGINHAFQHKKKKTQ